MAELTYDEYCEWLKKNKNKEEAMAKEVVDAIIDAHVTNRWVVTEYVPYFIPRKVINIDDRKLEFDLIIHLKDPKGEFDRLIGVEFKETDLKKVVYQALLRRWYVDYMYVATRPLPAAPKELILMSYMHIGWIVWDDDKKTAFIAMRSFYRDTDRLDNIVFTLVENRVEEIIEYTADKIRLKHKTLYDYL